MEKSKIKKSIILSGLIGSGGFFFAKLISLLYVIPLQSILGGVTYTAYYGTAYSIYTYFLNIFSAGFPLAVATLVAKYSTLHDAKTVLLIKKIAIAFLSLTGFVGMIIFISLSGILSPVMASTQNAENIKVMQTVLIILGVAIFFVPILSAYRGYIQGRKEIGEYAFSQTFEQVFRVGFLLIASCFFVYGLGWKRKWALYASVASTVVAAVVGLIQIIIYDKKYSKEINAEAKQQESSHVAFKPLFKEFILLAIPYLIVAVLGYSDNVFNAIFLPLGLNNGFYSANEIDIIKTAFNYSGTKILAIPMILAPGFISAIIPHISSALTENNIKLVRKNIVDCLDIILYLSIPICFCIFAYAGPIMYSLFNAENIKLSANVLEWLSIEALFGTLTPVIVNIMMSLQLRKSILKNLLIYTIIKGVCMIPLMNIIGFRGAIIATFIASIYLVLASLIEMHKKFNISFRATTHKLLLIIIAILGLWASSFLLTKLGLGGMEGSRIICFIKMGINGVISMAVYVGLTIFFQIPQCIFHIDLPFKKKSNMKNS